MPKIKLSKLLPLEDSFRRVLREERRARKLVPDALCFCDRESQKDEILTRIKKMLDTDSYVQQPLLEMEVPQDNFCIRPGAVPTLEDWVTYDAFVNYIGADVDSKLNPTVFSYRYNKSGKLTEGVTQWKKFEDSFWKVLELSNDSTYVLVTDITQYFANINLKVLKDNLLTLLSGSSGISSKHRMIVDKLFTNLLEPWAHGPIHEGVGIPQGVDASSILGNLFLHHVDAEEWIRCCEESKPCFKCLRDHRQRIGFYR